MANEDTKMPVEKSTAPAKCSIPFLKIVVTLIFISFAVSATVSAAAHPNLLFSDITEVPGYQYSTTAPWSTWKTVIIQSADASLSRDFSKPNWATYNRVSYRSAFATDLALAYQITKDQKYFTKARQALLNLDVGDVPYDMDRAVSLGDYALAYDWIQPALTPADDKIIRDKLAILADRTYRDLNGDGTKKDYVSFDDYHGQAYPSVAIAGIALEDYTNPNKIALKSGPKDWVKAGTEYLFVDDKLHSYGRSLLSFGFDEASGKHLLGSYKTYVIDDLIWWFQVYSNHYGQSIFDDYPAAKKIATSEIWETMPNGYMNNYITAGNTLETYQRGILSLLNNQEKGEMLNYLDQAKGNKLLPYSRENDLAPTKLLFCVYGNYDSVKRTTPDWTSRLNKDAIYQVFRGTWQKDSDWLSLVTFNVQTNSNRDSGHHDQLSIEYYGNGDLLLADAGETKYVPDVYYGQYDVHHNGVAIEDPRKPFAKSVWADSQARGPFKGNAVGITTPTTVKTVIQTSWMEAISVSESITKVIGDTWSTPQSLSSAIDYSRTIMYPEDDYFVVFDRFNGDEEWAYRNVFRPTSLSIAPTKGSVIGNVKGDLRIGGTAYNWLSQPYKTEKKASASTNALTWSTTNPYGDQVALTIYSTPASEVLVTKHTGRVAGYDAESEVYSPVVYLKSAPKKDLYRITVLSSTYLTEKKKTVVEVPVSGDGNALRVSSISYTDTIYSGAGSSTFGIFSTNAEMAFIRTYLLPTDYSYTLIKGTSMNRNSAPFITTTGTNSVSFNKKGNSVALVVDAASAGQISLYQIPTTVTKVMKDGAVYSGWKLSADKSAIIITTVAGTHEYSFLTSGELVPPLTATKAEFSGSPTTGIAPLTVKFTDASINATSVSWDFGDGVKSTEKSPSHVYTKPGTYTVVLTATGKSGSVSTTKTGYITAGDGLVPSTPGVPVAAFTANTVSGPGPLQVSFADQSKGVPTSWTWYFGDGQTSIEQNPKHSYTKPGTYTVSLRAINAKGVNIVTKGGFITVTQGSTIAPKAAFRADKVSGTPSLTVSFTDESTGNPATYAWTFGDGTTATEANPKHVYTKAGTYTVTLKVTNAAGTNTLTKTSYITVSATPVIPPKSSAPVAAFTANTVSGSGPLLVSFMDQSQGVPTSWTWYFGDGQTSIEQNPKHTYTQQGTYTVSLRAINANGANIATKGEFITITAEDKSAPKAAFTANIVTGKAPLTVSFMDKSLGSPTSWTWYFGDGQTSTDRNPKHTYTKPGTYTVSLRAINAKGTDIKTQQGFITVT